MRTIVIEAEILQEYDGAARVKFLTNLGDPELIVSAERIIRYEFADPHLNPRCAGPDDAPPPPDARSEAAAPVG